MNVATDPQTHQPASTNQKRLARIWLLLAIGVVGIVALRSASEPAAIEGVVIFNRQSRGHDDHFETSTGGLPPVGGVHHNLFQNCGIYRHPIEPEKAVHSLEHGAVWITHRPDLPEADIALLRELIRGQDYFLLSPLPDQTSPIVLTAWGAQLQLNSIHDERLDQFIDRYLLGPLTPERGASCKGGFGDPLP